MSPKTLFLTSLLVALDVVSGLNPVRLRALEPLQDGVVLGYSLPPGLLRRQTTICPPGTRECARIGNRVACAGVCCEEDGEFSFGCNVGYYCDGTGANAGCCPVGRICEAGPPPPCVDYGEPALSPTSACPAAQPTCTTNSRGASVCSGDVTRTSTRSFTLTRTVTTTSEAETTTEEESTTSEPMTEPTSTEETTTVEETTTTMSEIPEETTTEASTTEAETTEAPIVTSTPTQSSNVTLTPLPPATSNSGRTSTVNLLFALASVAFAFFLF
ncbi:hypothetical protein TWF281_009216 [Arthrobotrys megalospora]